MAFEIGRINHLRLVRFAKQGAYLANEMLEEVLLPKKFIPDDARIDQYLDVFLYTDSEDRLVATTQTPFALRDEVAILEICDIVADGCYLDLGLDKHIFMPSKNPKRFHIAHKVGVFITLDKQKRLIARLGIKEHLKPARVKNLYATRGALVFEHTPLGFGCVVDGRYYGLLYHDQLIFKPKIFDLVSVQIDKIRPDGKLDLRLDANEQKNTLKERLQKEGVLEFNYDSSPESIAQAFGISKKLFKKTVSEMIASKKAILKDGRIIKV